MTTHARLEKLFFIAGDMQYALWLAQACSGSFLKRTIARHVLIRAKDFIDHARALRKPLRDAGYDVGKFHGNKEIYARTFEEYFAVARSRLGGHVQDLDFLARLDMWNEVEVTKLSYFTDGANEICADLSRLTQSAYAPPTKNGTEDLKERVKGIGLDADPTLPRVGADPLAVARPSTGAILNFSPVHQRAGQLCLIDHWVYDEAELWKLLSGDLMYARVLAAQLTTDVVSFVDCLTTRPDGSDQQPPPGLDDLMRALPMEPNAIVQFKQRFKFDDHVNKLRRIRNRIGAHVEADVTVPLRELLAELDGADVESTLDFYDKMHACFELTCRRSGILVGFVRDREPLPDVTDMDSGYVVPFENEPNTSEEPTPPPQYMPDYNDEATVRAELEAWIRGGPAAKKSSRGCLCAAFMQSDVVETVAKQLNGEPTHPTQLRLAHRIVLEALIASPNVPRSIRLLELICECARGDPAPLTEIVLRYARHPACVVPDPAIGRTLAEVGDWDEIWPTLSEMFERGDHPRQVEALRASFLVFLRDEGIARANRNPPRNIFEATLEPLLLRLSLPYRVVALLGMSAEMDWGTYGTDGFATERASIRDRLEQDVLALFGLEQAGMPEGLKDLLQSHDYLGICLLVGDALASLGRERKAAFFYHASERWVRAARHPGGIANLAIITFRCGRADEALRIASDLAKRQPQEPRFQILEAGVLAALDRAADSTAILERLVRDYALTPEEEANVNAVRAHIAKNASTTPAQ